MTIAPAADHRQLPDAPGFVGKLPSHGDFISRRLPAALLVPWETWLDAALERSREMLGEGWLKAYLSSPIWCFSLAPGCCGDRLVAGVMMPSLDRIGRYYPLTIMAPVRADLSATAIALGATAWFTRMEALALSCLADDFDFERFDTSILDEPFPSSESCESVLGACGPGAFLALSLSDLIRSSGAAYSVWWTSGSPPRYRVFRGLPPAEEFAQLLL
jgi:type VI secretion system protein ImpM